MEDMLAKIVEMDERARELTEEANREKVNSEADIAKAKEDVYNNYIEKARKRIAKNEITERKAADEKFKKSQQEQKEALERLEKTFSENCDKWVDSIVSAVIEG